MMLTKQILRLKESLTYELERIEDLKDREETTELIAYQMKNLHQESVNLRRIRQDSLNLGMAPRNLE